MILTAISPELERLVEARLIMDGGHQLPGRATLAAFTDEGALFGAFGTAYAPLLFVWMDSQKHHPRDALQAFQAVRKLMHDAGHPRILLPIQTDSTFYPFISRLGFELIGPCELWQSSTPPGNVLLNSQDASDPTGGDNQHQRPSPG